MSDDFIASIERLAILHVREAREAGYLAGYEAGNTSGFESGYRAAIAELRRLSDAERAQVADGSVR